MNITLTIREISNGVLVETQQPESIYTASPIDGPEYYPDLQGAFDALPVIARGAMMKAKQREREIGEQLKAEQRQWAGTKTQIGGSLAAGAGDYITNTPFEPEYAPLPEEAALVGGNEPAPPLAGKPGFVIGGEAFDADAHAASLRSELDEAQGS